MNTDALLTSLWIIASLYQFPILWNGDEFSNHMQQIMSLGWSDRRSKFLFFLIVVHPTGMRKNLRKKKCIVLQPFLLKEWPYNRVWPIIWKQKFPCISWKGFYSLSDAASNDLSFLTWIKRMLVGAALATVEAWGNRHLEKVQENHREPWNRGQEYSPDFPDTGWKNR